MYIVLPQETKGVQSYIHTYSTMENYAAVLNYMQNVTSGLLLDLLLESLVTLWREACAVLKKAIRIL